LSCQLSAVRVVTKFNELTGWLSVLGGRILLRKLLSGGIVLLGSERVDLLGYGVVWILRCIFLDQEFSRFYKGFLVGFDLIPFFQLHYLLYPSILPIYQDISDVGFPIRIYHVPAALVNP
jgi:hypothetical protein